jgi:hypothetical protein
MTLLDPLALTQSCRGLVTGIDLLVEEASHLAKWLSP